MRSRRLPPSFGVIAATLVAGCASTPPPALPPEVLDAEGALLCVVVRAKPPLALPGEAASGRTVALVRMEDGGDVAVSEDWVQSNVEDHGAVYLAGAEPGKYYAVATAWPLCNAFLDEDGIRRTEIEVPAGGVVFLGELRVDCHMRWSGADRAQEHYRELLYDERYGNSCYRASIDACRRDAATEAKALRKALERFRGSRWEAAIRARLEELERAPARSRSQ